jgi:ribosomal-protein-alanine N-acetyltransferase
MLLGPAESAMARHRVSSERCDGVVSLTRFGASDAEAMSEADRDPEHRRRFEIPAEFAPSLAHSRAVIERWERERARGVRFAYAVRDGCSGELLGGCELAQLASAAVNLSYWTHPAKRRRGFAMRAVALAVAIAFEELRAQWIEALVDPDNVASRRVIARAGFREAGVRDGRILYVHEAP